MATRAEILRFQIRHMGMPGWSPRGCVDADPLRAARWQLVWNYYDWIHYASNLT